MIRSFQFIAFLAGLAAVCWVGAGYVGSSPLALAVAVLIGAFYVIGALELRRFQGATSTLERALSDMREPPASLAAWLGRLHPSLQNAVRLRIEGERIGLPGPALAPYLGGLLVLLGMLGTFLGMVVTLNGTGIALESATDVQSIRASLSAPVKGLGLAFGTSVAGVAASAMLGLVATLCRRERLQALQKLDAKIATDLRAFSLAHHREATFALLQQQAGAMPELVDRLQALMATTERQAQVLNDRLIAGQDGFHAKAEVAYTHLAASVDRSLRESLTESARVAGATIRPVVEATMAEIAREATALHTGLADTVQRQLDGVSDRFENATANVAETWRGALAHHERVSAQTSQDTHQALTAAAATFEQHAASLLRTVDQAHRGLQSDTAQRDQQRLADWTRALQNCADDISARTEAQARNTIAETARFVDAASQAPRAAAEAIAELQRALSDSTARDNAMLQERARLLESLSTLLDTLGRAGGEQRAAIDALVAGSADLLERVGDRFMTQAHAHAEKMAATAAQVGGSAVEVASLGEAFGFAVQLFSQSNDRMVAQLQRIEGALGQSIARSDEQLAYYVAQAREVIDLSLMSQKQILDDMRQLARSPALAGSEA